MTDKPRTGKLELRRSLGFAGAAVAGTALAAPLVAAPVSAEPAVVGHASAPTDHGVPAGCIDSDLIATSGSGIYTSPSFNKRGCYNDVNVIHAYYTATYRGQYFSGGSWHTGTAGWMNITSGHYADSSTWKVLISNLATGTPTRWQSSDRPGGLRIAS